MKDLMDYTLEEIKAHCTNHFAEAPMFAPTYFCEGCELKNICDKMRNYTPIKWNFERRTNANV